MAEAKPAAKPRPSPVGDEGGKDVLQGLPRNDGMAVASMWCGIASLLVLGLVTGPLGVVFGILSLRRMKEDPSLQGRGMAITGIVVGAVGFVATALVVAYYFG